MKILDLLREFESLIDTRYIYFFDLTFWRQVKPYCVVDDFLIISLCM